MIANYHTHTWRCNHAIGTEDSYVRSAIDAGLVLLGFSDHAPYCFPNGYSSGFRMEMDQLPDYSATVNRLKAAYQSSIDIFLGLEMEYYPSLFSQMLPVLQEQGIQYLLLGQHFVGDEIGQPYCGRPTADETLLSRYCAQVMDAMQTGCFTYLAHPDLLHYTGSSRVYTQHMRRLCQEAKSCGMPLELNLLGLRENRHYPDSRFWAVAGEEGCSVILGCDAHSPDALLCADAERQAKELVRTYGLKLLDTVPLRSIL